MRASSFARSTSLVALACLFAAGLATPARAQGALCPASPTLSNGAKAQSVSLQAGLCTNRGTPAATTPRAAGGLPTGAFSGAALATQALTELSQATTREITRSLQDGISKRRDDERELCSAGFTLAGGACESGRSVAAPTMPGVVVPFSRAAQRPVGLPDSSFRLSSWVALHGDYEQRRATGSEQFTVGAWGGGTLDIDLPISVRTRTGTLGFTFGGDATVRGVIAPDDGLIAGLILGYLTTNATIATSSGPSRDPTFPPAMGAGASLVRAATAGLSTGAYVVYFNGGFSTDLLVKADVLTLDESFDDRLSFTNPAEGESPLGSAFSGTGRFGLINTTLAANLDYRFVVHPNLWIEPTVGAHYTHSAYGNGAADFGLDDGDLVTVQGGARLGIPVLIGSRALVTTTVTGLAYSDVVVSGGFVPGAAFLASNLLANADRGQVRGLGAVAITLDLGNGISSFVQGEARGGKGLFGAGGRTGIRIFW